MPEAGAHKSFLPPKHKVLLGQGYPEHNLTSKAPTKENKNGPARKKRKDNTQKDQRVNEVWVQTIRDRERKHDRAQENQEKIAKTNPNPDIYREQHCSFLVFLNLKSNF